MTQAEFGALKRLQQRAFGGEDVAARPDAEDEAWWPISHFQPGVSELIADLTTRLYEPTGLSIYFLVGGAGNGKSFAARALAKRLKLEHKERGSGLAQRAYEVSHDIADVIIVNDATIAPHEDYRGRQAYALSVDIEHWWERSRARPVVVFCCVNRGIVVDELRALQQAGHQGMLGEATLRWLAEPEVIITDLEELGFVRVKDFRDRLSLGQHFAELSIALEDRPLRLFSLAVDVSSLMDDEHSEIPEGLELFQEVVTRCGNDMNARPESCPIRANLEQFSHGQVVVNWTALLRAVEVASGRLMSYRDLWGIIVMSLLGPRTFGGSGSSLDFIDKTLAELEAGLGRHEQLYALVSLARFRVNGALFNASVPVATVDRVEPAPATPFQTGFSLVDAALWGSSDSQHVETAIQALTVGERPSVKLCHTVPGINQVWSLFDQRLEGALVEYIQSDDCSDDSERRRLVSWYGAYLSRLCLLATGNFGNARVLKAWDESRQACSVQRAPLPVKLQRPLKGLLFPYDSRTGDHRVLVQAFAPRMEPLGDRSIGKEILATSIEVSTIALHVRMGQNRLILECLQAGSDEVIGELVLDFPLIREALVWHCSGAAQTESTAFVEPRLERCRSASLSALPAAHKRLVAIVGEGEVELKS